MIAVALCGLLALAPVIREALPPGAQRGKSVKVVLKGEGLTPTSKLISDLPGSVTRLTGAEYAFLVELKPDAPVGLYPLRLVNEDGLSNLILFSVGSLPESSEVPETAAEVKGKRDGAGDTREAALALKWPLTLNGTLDGPDVDYYALDVRAPQKLVIEVDARRAGSAVDPAFEVEDAQGKVIAKADDSPGCGVDARLEVSFTRPGRYFIRLHDSKYSIQDVNFYRLKVGQWQFADTVFPLGAARGTTASLTLAGGNLAAPRAISATMPAGKPVALVQAEGSASLPLTVLSSEGTVDAAAAPGAALHDRAWVNARLEKAGAVHDYKLAVEPGQSWLVELMGRAAGPTLADPFVTVYGPGRKKLATRNEVASAAMALPFVVPAGVREVTVSIEELLGRGGAQFGYRVRVNKAPADFVASVATPFVNLPAGGTVVIPVAIQRRGYDGPIVVSVLNAPAGVRVAGGHIPSEAAAQNFNNDNAGFRGARGALTLTAPADLAVQMGELKLVAKAETPQGTLVRELSGPALSVPVRGLRQGAVAANWLGYRLPFSTARALPVSVGSVSTQVRMAQGFEIPLGYRIQRRGGAGPVTRVASSQPSAVGNLRIGAAEPGKSPDTGSMSLQSNFATPLGMFDLLVLADATIDGKTVTIPGPAIEIEVVPGFHVYPASKEIPARAGGAFTVTGEILREPTFEGGIVRLTMQELPEGVTCQGAELAADARAFSMACQAATGVKPGSYPVLLTSAAPEVGRKAKAEYKGPETALTLRVGN
ncbi:MAG: PPC domain-containing protein [Acidobacteria bacterium]|nr:PPC domain-containing protein [Acidobacteriota bacterium]